MTSASHRTYYCHACASARGHLSFDTKFLSDSTYQLGKLFKHTTLDPALKVLSLFSSRDTATYEGYIVNSSLSGSAEIDERGRTSIIWGAGKTIGMRVENGVVVGPEDVVRVVRSHDSLTIHAFSQRSTDFSLAKCAQCGANAIY